MCVGFISAKAKNRSIKLYNGLFFRPLCSHRSICHGNSLFGIYLDIIFVPMQKQGRVEDGGRSNRSLVYIGFFQKYVSVNSDILDVWHGFLSWPFLRHFLDDAMCWVSQWTSPAPDVTQSIGFLFMIHKYILSCLHCGLMVYFFNHVSVWMQPWESKSLQVLGLIIYLIVGISMFSMKLWRNLRTAFLTSGLTFLG